MQVKAYITLGVPALVSPAVLFLKSHLDTALLFERNTIWICCIRRRYYTNLHATISLCRYQPNNYCNYTLLSGMNNTFPISAGNSLSLFQWAVVFSISKHKKWRKMWIKSGTIFPDLGAMTNKRLRTYLSWASLCLRRTLSESVGHTSTK